MSHVRKNSALAVLTLLSFAAASRAEPYRFPEGKVGKTAELKYVNGLPVLKVAGTPNDIGQAVGTLAMKPAQKVLDYPIDCIKAFLPPGLDLEKTCQILINSGTQMYKGFPDDFKTEMDGMSKASGIGKDRIILGNTLFDIKKLFLCSAVLVDAKRSATGGPLLGRNLDYPSLGYVHEYSLVTIYHPKGKHAFVSVGFPGLVGCLSGMNDAGLSLAILEVFDIKKGEDRFDIHGTPYALCYRRLLEECTTIEQAKELLATMHRTTTTNLVLADKTGVAVLEVSPKHVVQRPAGQGMSACTNHFCTAEMKAENPRDLAKTFERQAALDKMQEAKGKVTVAAVQKQLDEVNLGIHTLQTMVFEPATLKLHLAFGEIPASRGEMKTIDLAPLFKDK